ncbi:homing endonuclease [Staphylococcus phage vB_StaM_PB50]|nr:homing endonuclease [Staphylococcus phage vB_StaM_PB50]
MSRKFFSIEDVKEEVKNKCILLSKEYVNTKTKMDFVCLKCNKEFQRTFEKIKVGKVCPHCGIKKRSLKKSNFNTINEKLNIYHKEYVSGDYKNINSKIVMRDKRCGHEFENSISQLRKRKSDSCPVCNPPKFKIITHEEFEERLSNLFNGDIICLDEYKTNTSKNKFKCVKCNHTFYKQPRWIYEMPGCPMCRKDRRLGNTYSRGEKNIIKFLEKNNIDYIKEKTFPDLKYKKSLRFDFYVSGNNTLIEFDGRQHNNNHRKSMFRDKDINKRDELKNNFCKEREIPLLRINFYEMQKIDKILINWFNDYPLSDEISQ